MMKLKIMLPERILLERQVTKVTAEAENGFFTLLPRHVDFLSALVPGLLSFLDERGKEEFIALDAGILVKCGSEVRVSTRRAVIGAELGALRQKVEDSFKDIDDREQKARMALARLEVDLVRRFFEWSGGHE